jgi:hypothetical protein
MASAQREQPGPAARERAQEASHPPLVRGRAQVPVLGPLQEQELELALVPRRAESQVQAEWESATAH